MKSEKISQRNSEMAKMKTHRKGSIFGLPKHIKDEIDNMFVGNMNITQVRREISKKYPEQKFPSGPSFHNYYHKHFSQQIAEKVMVEAALTRVRHLDGQWDNMEEQLSKLAGNYNPVLIWLRQCERIEKKLATLYKDNSVDNNIAVKVVHLEAQLNASARNLADTWEKLTIKDRTALAGINSLIVNVINGRDPKSDQKTLEEASEEVDFARIIAGLQSIGSDDALEIIEREEVTATRG